MTTIPEKEVLRYLRASESPDEAVLAQIREISTAFEKRVVPKCVYRETDLSVTDSTVSFDGYSFEGGDFYKHLHRCSSILLFAATLGVEADRIVRTESARSMLRGSIAHAVGAAMIEQYCDDMQDELGKIYEDKGLYLRPRYSPGYGNLPLSFQKDFFRLLQPDKHLGISLSEHFTMTPSKSVTAIIGISNQKGKSFRKCLRCGNKECPFRREG